MLGFALLLVISSCKKGEDIYLDEIRTQLTAQEYLDRYVDQKIVFQYGENSEDGKLQSGWVIDKTGSVMGFDFGEGGWETEGNNCSVDDMTKLEAMMTEKLTTVDLEELVKYYKQIASLANTSPEVDGDSNGTAFYAYRLRQNSDIHHSSNSGSCDQERDSGFSSSYYDQVLLEHRGERTLSNGGVHAREMLNWLSQIEAEIGR